MSLLKTLLCEPRFQVNFSSCFPGAHKYSLNLSVRQSDTVLSLSSVVSSLPLSFLSSHMNTLRRDLTTHYIDHLLKQPVSVMVDSHEGAVSPAEFKLTIFPEPPTKYDPLSRIENLARVLEFLRDHLLPFLPQSSTFALSLCKPITTAVLNHLLIPSMPSSLDALPNFLLLVQRAVDFERDYVGELLGDDSPDKEVKIWADAVDAHYERKRRVDLLECARAIITHEENDGDAFRVEVLVIDDSQEEPLEKAKNGAVPPSEPIPIVEEDAWGLEEEPSISVTEEENGWDFEDDVEPAPKPEPAAKSPSVERSTTPTEDDPSDAWGWNDDESTPLEEGDESTDSSAWDDPWGDEPAEPTPRPVIEPKAATRLEKLSNKSKPSASVASSTVTSPVPTSVPPPTPAMPFLARQATTAHNPPPPVSLSSEKEWYIVSGRVKEIIFLVEDVLNEASQLMNSKILSTTSHHAPVGSILGQTSSFVLELYRALYPVAFANSLSISPKRAFCYANDCLWLSNEVKRVSHLSNFPLSIKDKLGEGQDRLRAVADSWYEDSIVSYLQLLTTNVTDLSIGQPMPQG